ncbi:uncharacterized protein BYT42DRAFT_613977 [Radiomyces spectabilis]|uniref:uncharacterized protein n=1 Tax=Radiomyces spectabilis TaxID=64574 RepID=UPI00221FD9B5|nr:uncharacterized protein BYT42DRAFT_613977 [Radiomyces spectabilis]KAI8379697.1 hypothetical protein BYT42DRAFT_613977 [Radiomyces spectabilis]
MLYTTEDIAQHNTKASCWIVVDDKVYDVTDFVGDHPGGEDILLQFAGTNITSVLKDPQFQVHSDAAYDLLQEYCIGTVHPDSVTMKKVVDKPIYTKSKQDREFLDLRKPLFPQLWNATYSKKFYLEQVHRPRYTPYYVPYFPDPLLDVLSRTSWYMVPTIWLPFVVYQLYCSLHAPFGAVSSTFTAFAGGILFWTLFEYVMHRFLFHLDDLLPDHPIALLLHFTLHGIHHHMPMDRMRLVMPPALTAILSIPVFRLAHGLFIPTIAYGVVAGAFFGYVCYDMVHYYLHHAQVIETHFKEMKRYHLAHHYKDYESGFGITSKIWDYIFGTVLVYD